MVDEQLLLHIIGLFVYCNNDTRTLSFCKRLIFPPMYIYNMCENVYSLCIRTTIKMIYFVGVDKPGKIRVLLLGKTARRFR